MRLSASPQPAPAIRVTALLLGRRPTQSWGIPVTLICPSRREAASHAEVECVCVVVGGGGVIWTGSPLG